MFNTQIPIFLKYNDKIIIIIIGNKPWSQADSHQILKSHFTCVHLCADMPARRQVKIKAKQDPL